MITTSIEKRDNKLVRNIKNTQKGYVIKRYRCTCSYDPNKDGYSMIKLIFTRLDRLGKSIYKQIDKIYFDESDNIIKVVTRFPGGAEVIITKNSNGFYTRRETTSYRETTAYNDHYSIDELNEYCKKTMEFYDLYRDMNNGEIRFSSET